MIINLKELEYKLKPAGPDNDDRPRLPLTVEECETLIAKLREAIIIINNYRSENTEPELIVDHVADKFLSSVTDEEVKG